MKTFEEFQNEVLDYAYNRKPVEWRYGQAVFNYIDEHYNVARQVQFIDKVDCFYNDELIEQFILLSYRQLCIGL
jgi:hypothetical protein